MKNKLNLNGSFLFHLIFILSNSKLKLMGIKKNSFVMFYCKML